MAPPRKRKTTPRQRRKQAIRTDVHAAGTVQPEEPVVATSSGEAKGKPRKGKKPVPTETWPRRELAILIGAAVVLQAVFAAPLGFIDFPTFLINFLSLNPFLLAPAAWIAMLLVYKRLGVRRMRFLEAMVMAMMLFFVANTAGGYLVGGLNTSSSSPPAKASASPSPHSTPTAQAAPTPTSRAQSRAASKPCPVDNPNCAKAPAPLTATQLQEEYTALALAMLLAIATTIWGFPTVYRWIWGPRKPRTPPAKGKK